jgi:hypothetical protein
MVKRIAVKSWVWVGKPALTRGNEGFSLNILFEDEEGRLWVNNPETGWIFWGVRALMPDLIAYPMDLQLEFETPELPLEEIPEITFRKI